MTEQEEVLHSIAIEAAVQELGIDKVMEIIKGIEEKELAEYFKNKDDNEKDQATKG